MTFTLRPWTINDLDSLVKYANNNKIADNMTDQFPHPYSMEDGKKWISIAGVGEPKNFMAIEINGEAVGGIGIHPEADVYRKNAEMGYWLAEPFWGKGVIPGAIKQMVDYAFKNFDIDRIYARPFVTNKASQRVLEKSGFILEAKFEKVVIKHGVSLDQLVYAIRR